MLSQPMAGKTEKEIVETRNRAIKALGDKGYVVLDTYFSNDWAKQDKMKTRGVQNIPICFLAKAIDSMSMCNAVYFCKGWEGARGCRIEHEVAKQYGMTIIYEED